MIEPLLQAERLLLHGMVDQAEALYRRTAEQDPLNAIAVVGLARVALERGDDELAYEHARAALAIDPQNAAAIRLEARLGEVLRVRADSEAAADGARSRPTPDASADVPAIPPAAPDARTSEQAVFARNPSMADHQRRMDQREQPTDATSPTRAGEPAAEPSPTTRRSLLRRFLGRRERGG